ncbi:MAG: hypothetical protein JO216_16760 [Hyphomicrobiales bacterium]|nr:hypothetical protein [Hyphomicrobiales bacterium]
MTYFDEWRAISARIRGLAEAAELDSRYIAVTSWDGAGSWRFLRSQYLDVTSSLEAFGNDFSPQLALGAVAAIERTLPQIKKTLTDHNPTTDVQINYTREAIVQLRALEAELTFLFSDTQERVRSTAERAFQHLRRLIAVDEEVRGKWQKAYDDNETRCEALGAVHLLAHGIFAFKADAAGARTDLVFHEPARDDVGQYAETMVLTEWKIAPNQKNADKQFDAARRQAALYAEGPLATFELRDYRYIVLVTPKAINVPSDTAQGGVTYRHINIPVRPDTPSVEAKRKRP